MHVLSPPATKVLKSVHLAMAALWAGGAVALVLLYFLKLGADSGGVLYGIDLSVNFIDTRVIFAGALGCVATGLVYGLFTPWGFFTRWWLVWKWAVAVAAVAFGFFYLNPWEERMMALVRELGAQALHDPAYLRHQAMHDAAGAAQVALLLATVFISVFKPGGRGRPGTREK